METPAAAPPQRPVLPPPRSGSAASHPPTAQLRLRPAPVAGGNARFLEAGDRPHVALHPQQRNHRRLSHQNGSPATTSLRIQKLRQLSVEGCGNVLLITREPWAAPIFGVEPCRLRPVSPAPDSARALSQ